MSENYFNNLEMDKMSKKYFNRSTKMLENDMAKVQKYHKMDQKNNVRIFLGVKIFKLNSLISTSSRLSNFRIMSE